MRSLECLKQSYINRVLRLSANYDSKDLSKQTRKKHKTKWYKWVYKQKKGSASLKNAVKSRFDLFNYSSLRSERNVQICVLIEDRKISIYK